MNNKLILSFVFFLLALPITLASFPDYYLIVNATSVTAWNDNDNDVKQLTTDTWIIYSNYTNGDSKEVQRAKIIGSLFYNGFADSKFNTPVSIWVSDSDDIGKRGWYVEISTAGGYVQNNINYYTGTFDDTSTNEECLSWWSLWNNAGTGDQTKWAYGGFAHGTATAPAGYVNTVYTNPYPYGDIDNPTTAVLSTRDNYGGGGRTSSGNVTLLCRGNITWVGTVDPSGAMADMEHTDFYTEHNVPLFESGNFLIETKDIITNATITNFTATITNGTHTFNALANYSEYVGFINVSGLWNLTINKSGYNTRTYLNHDTSTSNNLTTYIVAGFEIKVNDSYYNNALSNFTVSLTNGTTTHYNTSDGTSITYFDLNDLWNITINKSGYVTRTYLNYNTTLTNLDAILNYSYGRVNVSAYQQPENTTPILNFTVNVSYLNGTLIWTGNTTTGSLLAEMVRDISNNVTIDAFSNDTSYEIKSATLDGTDQSYNFSLYSTNSFLLTFYDSQTLDLLNNINVTFFFMGASAFNGSTDNGSFYVDLLLPSEYTIVSTASGYRQTQYITTLTDRSHTTINLYLINESESTLVLLTVQDKYGNNIQGADIYVQHYVNNGWIDEQILRTDQQGRTEGSFILATAYYNFYIKYDGSVVDGNPNNDSNKKTIYAEDVANGIIFYIDILEDQLALNYHNSFSIATNLSYINTSDTTGHFRWYWIDTSQWNGCLEVFKSGSGEMVCSCASTLATASTGTLTCTINQSVGTQLYTANGIIQVPTANQFIFQDLVLENMIKLLGEDTRINWGVGGYLIGFFLVLVSYFIFLNVPTVSLFFGTGVFIVLALFGIIFKDINIMVLITMVVITYLVATIKSEGGLNA